MTPFIAEIIGTMILVILGDGVVAGVVLNKSKAQNSGWIVITMGWGLAVAVGVYSVGSISGAHLNPAVTIGLASIGLFPWTDVPKYILAQMIGALLGAVIIWLQYFPHWKETDDASLKLAAFSTGPAIPNRNANLMSEIIGTFVLVFGILAIGVNKFTEGLNPLIVGFLVVAIGLSLGGTTGYAINPARDLGPRIAHFLLPIAGKGPSDWKYAWIPVVGPIIGGVLGAVFYHSIYKGTASLAMWGLGLVLLTAIAFVQMGNKKTQEHTGKQNKLVG
ncbi:MIP/aquaporin family protein [Aneurinibacillus terranovensis]|uniref:MIP/aquaporin family protein n=1 Tax=Aneurinibacillus terranovensis TaxID=278991 RepID=UPI000407E71F|nr:MIP/aquaporin family protein [Aneurinibacillus terranovensis]